MRKQRIAWGLALMLTVQNVIVPFAAEEENILVEEEGEEQFAQQAITEQDMDLLPTNDLLIESAEPDHDEQELEDVELLEAITEAEGEEAEQVAPVMEEETEAEAYRAADNVVSGTAGENVTWSLDTSDGVLHISGTGEVIQVDEWQQQYLDNIMYIVVDEGITSLGWSCFYGLSNVRSVQLPKSLENISRYALGRTALERLSIPENVSTIGEDSFCSCSSLKEIEVDKNNTEFCIDDGILYNSDQTNLFYVPAGETRTLLIIPSTVRYIDYDAIRHHSAIKSVIFQGRSVGYSYKTNIMPDRKIKIYAQLTEGDWSEPQNDWSKAEWYDLAEMEKHQQLSVDVPKQEIAVGEETKLTALLDPMRATEFNWTCSDSWIAGVDEYGKVVGFAEGEVEITVESADGQYRASAKIKVTDQEPTKVPEQTEDGLLTLQKDTIQYTYNASLQIPYPSKNGIYILNQEHLLFYSMKTGRTSEVCTLPGTMTYSDGEKLYRASNEKVWVYSLSTRQIERTFAVKGIVIDAIGADASGRIYLGSKQMEGEEYKGSVHLYSADGKELSTCELPESTYIKRFAGFDASTGNFYMESYYDYYSWGYHHPGSALTKGNVTNNQIQYVDTTYSVAMSESISSSLPVLMYLGQDYVGTQDGSAVILGGRYLVASSTAHTGVYVRDMQNQEKLILRVDRPNTDQSNVGLRCVYNDVHESIIVYNNTGLLEEYSLVTGMKIGEYQTKHFVFNMFWNEDSLVVIERDETGDYIEQIPWKKEGHLSLDKNPGQLLVGESASLTVESDLPYTPIYRWESSDNSVLSISEDGEVLAWKEGTSTVTVSVQGSQISASHVMQIAANEQMQQEGEIIVGQDTVGQNVSSNNYTVWATTDKSYLYETTDGKLVRVEAISGDAAHILVEQYRIDGSYVGQQKIQMELPIFGGFYAGKTANYLVFGQKNEQESDECEVVRIVRYDQQWNRTASCSIKGANTYIPFDAGSLRMTETDGKLYIHTCHEMYMSDDGLHHQANMTFVVDEEAMTVVDEYYEVMNLAQAGYVSHSFNQFIDTDGAYIYRVDHGDAMPRGIAITKTAVGDKVTNVNYTVPFYMKGGIGMNWTGASVGGLALSKNNCLIVGNSIDQNGDDAIQYNQCRNVFITVTTKDMRANKLIWLTEFKDGDGKSCNTPQIVKLGNNAFLVLWEEVDTAKQNMTTKMVTIDGSGQKTSEIVSSTMPLSDCQPIVTKDGMVRWYASNGEKVYMNAVNPFALKNQTETNLQIRKKLPEDFLWSGIGTGTGRGTQIGVEDDDSFWEVLWGGKKKGTSKKTGKTKVIRTKKINNVPKKLKLKKGKTYKIKAKLMPKTSTQKLTYKSSKKSVVTVSKKGKIKAKKKGKATIYVKSGKVKVKIKVTVK